MAINLLTTVSLALVGQLGAHELAAVCVAQAVMTGTLVLILGYMNGLSHLCVDAFEEAKFLKEEEDPEAEPAFLEVGAWLQVGLVLPLVAFFPLIVAVWCNMGAILASLEACQPESCELAQSYASTSLWWVVPFCLFQALSVYLETIGLVWTHVLINGLFSLIGMLANYACIFGLRFVSVPWSGMGLAGAPVAMALTQWAQLLVLVLFVFGRSSYQPEVQATWGGWGTGAITGARVQHFLSLGLPLCLWDLLELWVPGVLVLLAAHEGGPQVQAAGIVLNLVTLFQPLVLSFKYSMFARIDAHFEAGAPHRARDSYSVGVFSSMLLSLLIGIVCWRNMAALARGFGADPGAQHLASDMGLASMSYFVLYCLNAYNFELQNAKEEVVSANACSVLGRWGVGVGSMLLAVWRMGWGVKALWPCLLLGEFCHAILLLVLVCQTDWSARVLCSPTKAASVRRGFLTPSGPNYGTIGPPWSARGDSLSPSGM